MKSIFSGLFRTEFGLPVLRLKLALHVWTPKSYGIDCSWQVSVCDPPALMAAAFGWGDRQITFWLDEGTITKTESEEGAQIRPLFISHLFFPLICGVIRVYCG